MDNPPVLLPGTPGTDAALRIKRPILSAQLMDPLCWLYAQRQWLAE